MQKILCFLGITIFLTGTAFACRFTVREIGFADFGADRYHLYFFRDSGTGSEQADDFRKISYAALLDANVSPEIVDVQSNPQHPALRHYDGNREGQQVALVSHTGDALTFLIDRRAPNFGEEIWALVEKIISSKTRTAVLDEIVKSYAVVLIVKGPDENANRIAMAKVDSAIAEVRGMMAGMPKPVRQPPAVVELNYEEIESEQVFLWALGYELVRDDLPAITVLYGRGRQMGRLLPARLIGSHIVRNLLAFVGADCECGLERSWILGPMFPGRWNSDLQQQVLAYHHFDAENPLIKAEMSQILSISPTQDRTARNANLSPEAFSGYTENEIKLVNQSLIQASDNTGASSPMKYAVYLIAFLAVLISLIAGLLIVKVRRREY